MLRTLHKGRPRNETLNVVRNEPTAPGGENRSLLRSSTWKIDDALTGIARLNDCGVDYVVVGGVAMNLHDLIRATEGLDIFVRPDPGNIARLRDPSSAEFCFEICYTSASGGKAVQEIERLRYLVLGCAVLVASSAGCKFSASASGQVNSAGDANANAEIEQERATPKSKPPAPDPEKTITYRAGQLDYRGALNFEYDNAALRDDAGTTETLAEFRKFLAERDEVSIEIEGHTDSRGSDDYNRELSDRRAASVRQWLIEQGIAEARVTAIGKGEDEPHTPEPPECHNQRPADTAPCEAIWAENRRVVFRVTGGAERLEEENERARAPAPEPEPEPLPPAPPAVAECPWLWGGHLNAIGPNSWVIGAGAVQPGICWLEPSLGVGLGFRGLQASNPPMGADGDGGVVALNIPLRARFWFMERHSLIGDLGLELGHYLISADLTDSAGETAEYTRDSTTLMGHLGFGYGYRPNGYLAGPRLALVVGILMHASDLEDSSIDNASAGFNAAESAALQADLDFDSDDLTDPKPYAEISFGWLW